MRPGSPGCLKASFVCRARSLVQDNSFDHGYALEIHFGSAMPKSGMAQDPHRCGGTAARTILDLTY